MLVENETHLNVLNIAHYVPGQFGLHAFDFHSPSTIRGCIVGLNLLSVPDLRNTHWQLTVALSCFAAWLAGTVLWRFWWKAPSNVLIMTPPTILGRWYTALCMLLWSEELLERAYTKAKGRTFALPMFDRWIVCVSDPAMLRVLDAEPEYVHSRELALHQLSSTKQILGTVRTPVAFKNRKSEVLCINGSVLKNKLRGSLPERNQSIRRSIKHAIACEAKDQSGEWQEIRIMPALLQIFTRVSLVTFFGEELGKDPQVFKDVMSFFWSCAVAFPMICFFPNFLVPFLVLFATSFGIPRQRMFHFILERVRQAQVLRNSSDEAPQKSQETIITWITNMAKVQDSVEVAKVSLGLLFASAFQVPMIAQFVVHRLCSHTEYFDTLRTEALDNDNMPFTGRNQEMPYLDSFIKETARLGPGPLVSSPRTVMKAYTMSDGCHVPSGNWIAVPQIALMRDDQYWPHARTFDGFRFVDDQGVSTSRLTHPAHEFPFWGSTRHACPARFYVSATMKMVLSHLLTDYEIRLADPAASSAFNLAKARLPNPLMMLQIRKRIEVAGGE